MGGAGFFLRKCRVSAWPYTQGTGVRLTSYLGSFSFASFVGVHVQSAGLASYPIDTVRRRMMMTSGAAVKYKSSMHCMGEIVKNEGVKSLFKV